MTDPHGTYTRRLAELRELLEKLGARDRAIANGRLLAAGSGLALAWAAFVAHWLPGFWLLVPLLAFGILAVTHDGVLVRRNEARARAAFYERGLARLEERWAGSGSSGDEFRDPAHPYADDLDLFGRGSLFELLCTARTRAGEETLAAWLRAPAGVDEVRSRQLAVQDLVPRLQLREDLAMAGAGLRSDANPDAVIRWGESAIRLDRPFLRPVALFLTVLGVAAAGFWFASGDWRPLLAAFVIQRLTAARMFDGAGAAARDAEQVARTLGRLAPTLRRLETEQFSAPRLRAIQQCRAPNLAPASVRLARLIRLVAWLQARQNGVFGVIGTLLLWDVHFAAAIERWRAESGAEIRTWIRSVGELEALCSLAAYAYERPEQPFPEVSAGEPRFEAVALAHPLLPRAAVANDVRIGSETRLWIVSGSNMSGKSTLLRAVGVNAVLALAGGPVRAQSLTLTPVALGASLRIQDSLQSGVSHFYAEITRLRQVVDLAGGTPPLLFLLDEILHGTNSHDRSIGAEAVLRSLVQKGAIGFVTTHDLALTRLAEEPALSAVNVHFEDTLLEGAMHFDYRLRAGVVQRSNALALMRAVGLDV